MLLLPMEGADANKSYAKTKKITRIFREAALSAACDADGEAAAADASAPDAAAPASRLLPRPKRPRFDLCDMHCIKNTAMQL
jgi:hypothetical protein